METKTRIEFGYLDENQKHQQQQFRLAVKDFGDTCYQEVNLSSSTSPAFASMYLCRICHDEEEHSFTTMEAPCACSGTLKFAHRDCIQRWCDEKGSTVCEICLQNFEPGYTIPEKKALVEVAVTIRESLEIPRLNYDPQNPGFVSDDDAEGSHNAECAPTSHRSATWCRNVAIMFTSILLIRHFLAVVTIETDQYATILTMFLLRASGILLPCYLVLKFISTIQQAQRQNYLQQLQEEEESSIYRVEDNDIELQQHATEIRT